MLSNKRRLPSKYFAGIPASCFYHLHTLKRPYTGCKYNLWVEFYSLLCSCNSMLRLQDKHRLKPACSIKTLIHLFLRFPSQKDHGGKTSLMGYPDCEKEISTKGKNLLQSPQNSSPACLPQLCACVRTTTSLLQVTSNSRHPLQEDDSRIGVSDPFIGKRPVHAGCDMVERTGKQLSSPKSAPQQLESTSNFSLCYYVKTKMQSVPFQFALKCALYLLQR